MSPALWLNSETVRCEVPPTSGPEVVDLAVLTENTTLSDTSSSCSVAFEFVHRMMIAKIEPSQGNLYGGTVVNVVGRHFHVGSRSLDCIFGGVKVPASLVNSTLLVCVTPSRAARAGDGRGGH